MRSYSSVCDALCDVIYVFHVASFGLSGADQVCFIVLVLCSFSCIVVLLFQLLAKHIKDVNVGGTQNIIRGKNMCL